MAKNFTTSSNMNLYPPAVVFKQNRGGVGGCLVKQWRTQQQNVLENPQHPRLKQAPGVCEKTFSASFVPQPAENNTYYANYCRYFMLFIFI